MTLVSPRTTRHALHGSIAALVLVMALSGCLGKSDPVEPEDDAASTADADPAEREQRDYFLDLPDTSHDAEADIDDEAEPAEKDDKALQVSADLCPKEQGGLIKLGIGIGPIGVDACV